MENKRVLTGIWIPIEIWDDTNLIRVERDAFVEIMHLSKSSEKGCFASNSYFAKILRVSNGRVSQIISHLKEMGYIFVDIQYKEYSKEVDKRYIRVNYAKIYIEGNEEYERLLLKRLSEKYGGI